MMAKHPYKGLPAANFWKQSVVEPAYGAVDPVLHVPFTISTSDRVVTAGSCFAQHIARHLHSSGFNYYVTEATPANFPSATAAEYGYGVFSARYGNLYTSLQLIQTLQRAYGLFQPADDIWEIDGDRFLDPYRPQIQPRGFASLAEYSALRTQHFAAVRRAVEELDIFVFTLGLTETWVSRIDGAAYPVCPGVSGGVYDERYHEFRNLRAAEVVDHLNETINFIRERNALAKFIFTVSPVPLVATAEDRSVLVSTTYSKSVLRVAAEEIAMAHDNVAYFPSYEIIVGNYNRGRYFAEDLRSITEEGVSHVMRLFLRYYGGVIAPTQVEATGVTDGGPSIHSDLREAFAVVCEEEVLSMDIAQS